MSAVDPGGGNWIAFYGSLMRGLGGMSAVGLEDRVRFVGPCVLSGELFDLTDYPAMRHGDGRIIAELHALLDVDVLGLLDEFEGYNPASPRESLYLRERVRLIAPAATPAWVYIYNDVPDARTRIADGDWRRRLSSRDSRSD